jgi:hypothetical protein
VVWTQQLLLALQITTIKVFRFFEFVLMRVGGSEPKKYVGYVSVAWVISACNLFSPDKSPSQKSLTLHRLALIHVFHTEVINYLKCTPVIGSMDLLSVEKTLKCAHCLAKLAESKIYAPNANISGCTLVGDTLDSFMSFKGV